MNSKPDNDTGAVRVAVNTMRARLTLLGFNLAAATFQLTSLSLRSGGVKIPGLDHPMHLAPGIVLLLGIALSFAAMVAFVASGQLDERGDCSHWSLLLGDVLMYLAMAQSLTGLFEPFVGDLETARLEGASTGAAFGPLRAVLVTAGGVAWAAAAYVGPIVSLLRSPFGRGATTAIGIFYVLALIALAQAWVMAQQAELALGAPGRAEFWFQGLAAPLTWW